MSGPIDSRSSRSVKRASVILEFMRRLAATTPRAAGAGTISAQSSPHHTARPIRIKSLFLHMRFAEDIRVSRLHRLRYFPMGMHDERAAFGLRRDVHIRYDRWLGLGKTVVMIGKQSVNFWRQLTVDVVLACGGGSTCDGLNRRPIASRVGSATTVIAARGWCVAVFSDVTGRHRRSSTKRHGTWKWTWRPCAATVIDFRLRAGRRGRLH